MGFAICRLDFTGYPPKQAGAAKLSLELEHEGEDSGKWVMVIDSTDNESLFLEKMIIKAKHFSLLLVNWLDIFLVVQIDQHC